MSYQVSSLTRVSLPSVDRRKVCEREKSEGGLGLVFRSFSLALLLLLFGLFEEGRESRDLRS